MLSFFDSITSFISTIWGYLQNWFEMVIELYSFLGTFNATFITLLPALPSMVGLGVSLTLSIMIVRFLLLK